MKIFWSWQSDTPGKTGRFLVRDALREAIEQLKEAPDIEEPTAKATREALHLDHDIQGVTGSPDLARTILDKINGSELVIADVTLVGKVPDRIDSDGKAVVGKKLINSNVAIELGYALDRLTDANVLMVFNRHCGDYEDLPFDLRHKGGIIDFTLAHDAPKERISEERKKLKDRFVLALRPYLQRANTVSIAFNETPSTFCKAAYFADREVLAHAGTSGQDEVRFSYTTDRLCYLRLIPGAPLARPIALAKLTSVAQRTPVLTGDPNALGAQNDYGAIGYQPAAHPHCGPAALTASTQLFQNGEIWSVSASLIITERGDRPVWVRVPSLPCLPFEQTYYRSLHSLVRFAAEQLSLQPPWQVECGLTGTKGLHLYGLREGVFVNESVGPIRKPEITYRMVLNEDKEDSINHILVEFYRQVYDCAGYARPEHLYGFPPRRPSPY